MTCCSSHDEAIRRSSSLYMKLCYWSSFMATIMFLFSG
uniref:Uncharacterized protein n=1 Tax=Arundo donax TaxID=35708 RepID=A0A0A9BE64_ARUDO